MSIHCRKLTYTAVLRAWIYAHTQIIFFFSVCTYLNKYQVYTIHINLHICIYIWLRVCINTHALVYILQETCTAVLRAWIYTHTQLEMSNVYTYQYQYQVYIIHTHTCKWLRVYINTHARLDKWICIYVYIYIYE